MTTRNNCSCSLPSVVAALLILFIGSSRPVTSFTAAPSRVVPTHASTISSTAPSPRPIHSVGGPFASATATATYLRMNSSPDTGGLGRGKILLIIALIANVWAFSIPVEFRRARLCTEEDVKLYPEKHCMTFGAWRTGVAEYYANGGGVKFDFSIEGKE